MNALYFVFHVSRTVLMNDSETHLEAYREGGVNQTQETEVVTRSNGKLNIKIMFHSPEIHIHANTHTHTHRKREQTVKGCGGVLNQECTSEARVNEEL